MINRMFWPGRFAFGLAARPRSAGPKPAPPPKVPPGPPGNPPGDPCGPSGQQTDLKAIAQRARKQRLFEVLRPAS